MKPAQRTAANQTFSPQPDSQRAVEGKTTFSSLWRQCRSKQEARVGVLWSSGGREAFNSGPSL